MITFRTAAEIKDDRQVTLTLPPEVPTGKAELVVTVAPQAPAHGQPDGRHVASENRYPLRGKPIHYDRPTEPIAQDDWEALQ